jgi:hypothetical protein
MINYNIPATGNTLLYPLEQVTTNVGTLRLQKLNTSPFPIVPLGNYISVVNVTLKYNNINLDISNAIVIGFESVINSLFPETFCQILLGGGMLGNTGVISLGTNFFNNNFENTLNSEPLVIYQIADDPTAVYNQFEITVTYLKF